MSVVFFMYLKVPNTNIVLQVNHPVLVAPALTPKLPQPKMVIVEKRKKA